MLLVVSLIVVQLLNNYIGHGIEVYMYKSIYFYSCGLVLAILPTMLDLEIMLSIKLKVMYGSVVLTEAKWLGWICKKQYGPEYLCTGITFI